MDISQLPIAISLLSLSAALLKQSWNGKKSNNGCYVKKEDCHTAMDSIDKRLDDFRGHFDTRIDDLKDTIKNGK